MVKNPFKGYGVALVTPFLDDTDVDYNSLAELIEFQIGNGVDFICALGTTAETPTLEDDEYQRLISFISERVRGRVPIMVGCSDNCTTRLCKRLMSVDFKDAKAVLVSAPAYNKPSQDGMYQHFMKVVAASPIPVVLYNVPGRTGVNMTAATILRLAESTDRFIAIKEASGNMEQIDELISGAPKGFGVLSGDDSLAVELIGKGAVGVVSVTGNAIPATFGKMVHLAIEGKTDEASAINDSLSSSYALLFKEGSPSGIKALMAKRSMLRNVLRLPMTPVSDALKYQIINGFAKYQK